VPRTTSARPIELGGEWQVIGRLIVRRKGRLAINGRRKNRTRAERIATEEVVDELGLAIRVAGADARKPAMRVVETGGEQRCDDIARRCYVELVLSSDLCKRLQFLALPVSFEQFVYTHRVYEKDGFDPHWRGIYDDKGRIMVAICHDMDLGDSWEHADNPKYPEKYSALGIRIGVNYIVYAMTH
jgi:hypothetical protein